MEANIKTHHLSSFAEEIVYQFESDKLVVVHLPRIDSMNDWTEVFCRHIHGQSGSQYEYRQQYQLDSSGDPWDVLCEALSHSNCVGWDVLLEDYGHRPPFFLLLNMPIISKKWNQLLYEMTRAYQAWDRTKHSKKIILILLGATDIPTWVKGPAVCYFQFWNVMTWEEMRTLGNGWISEHGNPYFRAWQIATYTGAAGLDPFLLYKLCLQAPENYPEVKEVIETIDSIGNHEKLRHYQSDVLGEPWRVPAVAESDWLQGRLVGITIDRGTNRPWNSIKYSQRSAFLHQSVWREQMTSLFPVIAEISDIVANAITKEAGSEQWKKAANENPYGYINEPSVIINVFKDRSNKLPYIPHSLWSLLVELRFVRNQLAHRKYVDSGAMRSLWKKVQDGLYGRNRS